MILEKKLKEKKDKGMKKIGVMEEIQGRKRSFGEIYEQWNVHRDKIP